MKKINISQINDEDIHYTESIIKKHWKKRKIYKPSDNLRELQRNILWQIKEYFFSLDFNDKKSYKDLSINKKEFKYVYSYIRKKNIADMAKNHLWKRHVLRIDIKSFFNSISKEMIEKYMKLFFEENQVEVDNFEDFLKIVSYDNFLPIWAITSPFISNVIWYYLVDKKISSYLNKNINYSRYADDLIFSFNDEDIKKYIEKIKEIINESWFEENIEKRKIYHKWQRQLVTWICVNWKKIQNTDLQPTIPIEKREEIRFYLYLMNKFWINRALEFYKEKIYVYGKKPKIRKKQINISEESFLKIIEWKINYFNMINKSQSEKLKKDFKFITSF